MQRSNRDRLIFLKNGICTFQCHTCHCQRLACLQTSNASCPPGSTCHTVTSAGQYRRPLSPFLRGHGRGISNATTIGSCTGCCPSSAVMGVETSPQRANLGDEMLSDGDELPGPPNDHLGCRVGDVLDLLRRDEQLVVDRVEIELVGDGCWGGLRR